MNHDVLRGRIDRELRMRGTTIEQWAGARGITPDQLVDVVMRQDKAYEWVLFDLREEIGGDCTMSSVRAAA